jgi:hypothetical protein
MRSPLAFLKFAARAALNAGGFGVAGDLVVDVLPDVARDLWSLWGQDTPAEQLHQEVQAVARLADAEARQQAARAVAEVAAAPTPVRQALTAYLAQVPAAIRRSQRRPADPTGRTASAGLTLCRPEGLLALLPAKLPRFKPGDRPPGVGDWVLEELLGVGGFGEVWKAKNPHLASAAPAALKFCLDPTAARLLRHEAAILDRVMREGRHPGIVPLRHTYLSADPPCLEYEYVEGGELTALIRESRGGFRPAEAARVVQQLAKIVGFAHAVRPPIVHRDLKSANILVQRRADGRLQFRVADFGIGGLAASRAIGETRRGTTRGQLLVSSLRGSYTPLYASQQQVQGEPPDLRDDVYALGVIWYQLLAGDPAAGIPADWEAVLRERGHPGGLTGLLGSCIASRPEKRPASAAALAESLAAELDGERAPAVIPVPVAPTPPPARRTSALPLVLAGVVLAVLVVGGLALWGFAGSDQHPPDTPGPVAAAREAEGLRDKESSEPKPGRTRREEEPGGRAVPEEAGPKATPAITRAVEKGVAALRRLQLEDGTWPLEHMGATALAGLTLLECGVPADDPAVARAAQAVRSAPSSRLHTYSLALDILFLDRLGEIADGRFIDLLAVRLLSGQDTRGGWSYFCPAVSEEEVRRLTGLLQRPNDLVAQRRKRVPSGKGLAASHRSPEVQKQLAMLREGASPATSDDNSNTQFATLGLWVARGHGLPVDQALARIGRRFRSAQNPDGGWGYYSGRPLREKPAESIPTMTCAALFGLAAAHGAAADAAEERPDLTQDEELRAGLVALAAAVGRPGEKPAVQPPLGTDYYFLWSLERVCVALGLQTIGDKDWYGWGAEVLLAGQKDDGTWRGNYAGCGADTCFALLFLKRSNLTWDLTAALRGAP